MQYRPEIDGLRAIAVLFVIFFHAGFQFFPGGFIGVDIFFVISGYLITTLMIRELEAGQFSIIKFAERRVRRILPALFLVMTMCVPFAWLWMMPADAKEFSYSVMAVLGFVSNVFFLQKSTYFGAEAELKPLLHTWSLGVEEQFYVLFPVALMLAWKLGRKRIVGYVTIAALLSLPLAVYAISVRPVAAFFLLPTRGWELAMGSLIAFYLEGKERDQFSLASNQLFSLIGGGLIVAAALTFSEETPFPGLYALIPTVGAGLIIVFALPGTFVGRLLVSRILVGVGLVSYSAYLWHQPLLSFARHRSLAELNGLALVGLVALTFGLAYVTWRFVETPFRRAEVVSPRVLLRVSLASAAVIAVFTAGLQQVTSEGKGQLEADMQAKWRTYTCFFEEDQTYATLLENHCDEAQGPSVRAGENPSGASTRFVLYGDSVAAHLYPGLVRVLGGEKIIQLTGGNCWAIRVAKGQRCADFYEWFVEEYLPNNKSDSIIVSSNWVEPYKRKGDKEFRIHLDALFEKLKGHRVIVYSQPAKFSVDIHRYVYKLEKFAGEVPDTLELEMQSLDAVNTALREESARFGFEFIDITQLFCSKSQCGVVKDGVVYFWDTIHLTVPGSVLVAELTQGLLTRIYAENAPRQLNPWVKNNTTSTAALMVRNLDGTIRYWSDAAKKLYGWESSDVLGRTSHQLFMTVFPVSLKIIEEELHTKGRWEGQLVQVRRDGSKVEVASVWILQKNPYSQGGSMKVIEINSPYKS